jgi:hypothetical protein
VGGEEGHTITKKREKKEKKKTSVSNLCKRVVGHLGEDVAQRAAQSRALWTEVVGRRHHQRAAAAAAATAAAAGQSPVGRGSEAWGAKRCTAAPTAAAIACLGSGCRAPQHLHHLRRRGRLLLLLLRCKGSRRPSRIAAVDDRERGRKRPVVMCVGGSGTGRERCQKRAVGPTHRTLLRIGIGIDIRPLFLLGLALAPLILLLLLLLRLLKFGKRLPRALEPRSDTRRRSGGGARSGGDGR